MKYEKLNQKHQRKCWVDWMLSKAWISRSTRSGLHWYYKISGRMFIRSMRGSFTWYWTLKYAYHFNDLVTVTISFQDEVRQAHMKVMELQVKIWCFLSNERQNMSKMLSVEFCWSYLSSLPVLYAWKSDIRREQIICDTLKLTWLSDFVIKF